MRITGEYFKDENFIYLFTADLLFTIARNTGDWGFVVVGGSYNFGQLTADVFNSWKDKVTDFGTFELK